VIAKTDSGSEAKAEQFEAQLVHHNNTNKKNYHIVKIPRSREVGQSYWTSIFTTIFAVLISAKVVLRERPDLILANGPGTCVPILLVAYLFRLIGVKQIKLVLAESYACVNHLSLTSRIMYPFVDLFTVQWPQLLSIKPDAKYTGRLPLHDHYDNSSSSSPSSSSSTYLCDNDENYTAQCYIDSDSHPEMKKSYVLITVGSTFFDQLIKTIDSVSFAKLLKGMGYTGMHIQIGSFPSIHPFIHSPIHPFIPSHHTTYRQMNYYYQRVFYFPCRIKSFISSHSSFVGVHTNHTLMFDRHRKRKL
jgi:beta-1,4-N-acetylglucosaminyltransferase